MSFGDEEKASGTPSDPPIAMIKKQAAPRAYAEQFHRKYGHPVRDIPAVPSDDEVRFRLRFNWEEFRETLQAAYADNTYVRLNLDHIESAIHNIINQPLNVNLPEFADGLADQDYVNEGTRLVFGINGDPIMKLVHRANMSKTLGAVGGKAIKPAGWQPPDVAGELERQGWKRK